MPATTVVILNWNRAADTLRCLESLRGTQNEIAETIVVDNGSTDTSCVQVRAAFPEVTLLETGANLGYAEGNNHGIRHALANGAPYIFVLNNDACVAPDTLACLRSAAEAHPDGAFFGPQVMHRKRPEQVQSAGIVLDRLWRSRPRDPVATGNVPQPVTCISGAAMFLRAGALEKIGLLDPDFYLYREDVDWCLRARHAGFAIFVVPDARVWHRDHRERATDLPRITYYMTRNSMLLLRKHKGGWIRAAVLLLRFTATALSWSVRPRWRNKRQERDALLRGLADFFLGRFGPGFPDE